MLSALLRETVTKYLDVSLESGKIAMEPHLFRLAPGAGSGDYDSHDCEEFLYLVRGRLAIWLRQEEFQIRPGDSFYFTSQTPHRWYNPGRTETIILWINTPAYFLTEDQIRSILESGAHQSLP